MLAIQAVIPKAATIGGLQDIHKEAKEYKNDIKGAMESARTGTQLVMNGGSNPLDSLTSGSLTLTGTTAREGGEGAAAGGQVAAI